MTPEKWEHWRRIASETALSIGSFLIFVSANQADIAAALPSKNVGAALLTIGFLARLFEKYQLYVKAMKAAG